MVAVLEQLNAIQSMPQRIAGDNGPEFISNALGVWVHQNGVQLEFKANQLTMPSSSRSTVACAKIA